MSQGLFDKIPVSRYFSEVMLELRKVSWPTREETIQMTVLVVVVSAIVSAYLGGLDYLFTQLTTLLLKY